MLRDVIMAIAGVLALLVLTLITSIMVEEGLIPDEAVESLNAAFSLISLFIMYVVFDMLREYVGSFWDERKSNAIIGAVGLAFFLSFGISELMAGGGLAPGLAGWSFALGLLISFHAWFPILETRVGPRLLPYFDKS